MSVTGYSSRWRLLARPERHRQGAPAERRLGPIPLPDAAVRRLCLPDLAFTPFGLQR